MPEICRFYGIVIRMFFSEHGPPHFHVQYGGLRAVFNIQPLELARGDLPGRARALVVEWAEQHIDELMLDWDLARSGKPLEPIRPLD